MFKNKLRTRFVVSFTLYAMVVIAIFALVVIAIERKLAEDFFYRRLALELEYFTTRYLNDPRTPLPNAEDITAYLGTDTLPESLRSLVSGFADGVYTEDFEALERNRWKTNEGRMSQHEDLHDLFFGIKTMPDGNRIFIFIDFIFWHEKQHHLEIHLFWAFLIVSLVGIVFGLLTGNRVIAPLNRLLTLVEKSSPENLPSGFSQVFKNDEFGTLARAFESSFQRIRQFVKREHQFTRDASHELRTPVTVMKGAVELLNMSPAVNDPLSQKLVKRIERSISDMETTIESLLWLARENNPQSQTVHTELVPLVQKAIAQNQHLITGKPIAMNFTATHHPIIAAPAGVVLITVSNLIRNACQYTQQGFIKVTVKADRVEVADSGAGFAKADVTHSAADSATGTEHQGFGFGLDIVQRICERFGWQLLIASRPTEGTTISLLFPVEV